MRTILPGGKLGGRIDNLTMLKITRAAPSEISKTVILKKNRAISESNYSSTAFNNTFLLTEMRYDLSCFPK